MKRCLVVIVLQIFLMGCLTVNGPSGKKTIDDLPNVATVDKLPALNLTKNEIEISDSWNEMDQSLVVGSLINLKTCKLSPFDNCLAKDVKLERKPLTEVAFRNFVNETAVAKTNWLNFLQGAVNQGCKAEVSVIKSAKVTAPFNAIDRAKLEDLRGMIADNEQNDYAIVIGYIDYLITASLFKDSGVDASGSGYGVKIEGKWLSKAENTNANHYLVAIWAPFPFIAKKASEAPKTEKVNLEKLTNTAIETGKIQVETPSKPLEKSTDVKKPGP